MYRLIIADDEENIRNGIANSLPWRDWGYEVCALCASGQEVLAKMETCRPDVVLSDIRMPGMDGVELMQRLSRDYPEVKIVILSGYSDFKYLNMSIKNHVAEYLLKPTDIDDFEESFRRLKAAMDHERLRPWFYVDTAAICRINLNTASLGALSRHPYLNFYQAKAIWEYRQKNGSLDKLHALALFDEFNEADLRRLAPYVCFD